MQYFITYTLGHQSTSGKKAQLGTIVHKVMEVLAGCEHLIQRKKKMLLEDDALGDIKFTKKKLASDEFVNDILKKSYDWYTENCTHKYTPKDYKFCEELTWEAINYNGGLFDPRNRNIVAAEPHFDIVIEEDWAKYEHTLPNGEKIEGQLAIKGTIDLVTEVEDGIIEVVDWKTGRRLDWATGEEKTYEKLCSDPQLLLYNYAISKLFPDYKQSIMTIFYIRDGGPFSMCFDKKDEAKFLEMLKRRFQQICRNNTPKPMSYSRNHWKCTKLCHFYKNKWPGTNKNMCIYIEEHLKKHGMDETVKSCTKKGFNVGYYNAPG
tara:strand:+ start:410 stop:1369 length:960 start_codon:yes stop_codon:yes gene_type:complete